jgi:hypothetical protein
VSTYREQRGQGDFATRFARDVMLATPRGVISETTVINPIRRSGRACFAEAVERADVKRPAVVLDPDAPTLLASGHVSDAASAVALRARPIRGESVSAYGGGWGNYWFVGRGLPLGFMLCP